MIIKSLLYAKIAEKLSGEEKHDETKNKIRISMSMTGRVGLKDYREAKREYRDAGFTDVRAEGMADLDSFLSLKDKMVDYITVDGQPVWTGEYYYEDSPVVIYYHSCYSDREDKE